MTKPLRKERGPLPEPTEEMAHILELVRSTRANLQIRALAGSGKTTMLEMIQNAASPPVLCIAFNRRIADEMVKRFRTTTSVRTFNGLGHRIWAAACGGNLTLNPRKVQELLREEIKQLPKPDQGEAYDNFWEIIGAVNLAKSLGYVPDGKFPTAKRLISTEDFYPSLDEVPSDFIIDLVEAVLLASIKTAYAGAIDYNDQVYMPALFGGTYPNFPLVLVDEEQDLSPVNYEMLSHMQRSRLVTVGDPRQSIYAFRGAVRAGMDKARERFQMTEATLSVSFRCPQAIVENARWHAPHMKWFKEGGRAVRLRNPLAHDFLDGSAIICRNNAPLFSIALRLLSNGRSVSVSGSDVGPKVIGIMRKLGPETLTQERVYEEIEGWRQEKLARQSTTANDIADCMRVFASFGNTLSLAISYAAHLFEQKGTINLLTGHKAKGLEWNTVYHLDPWLLKDHEQDLNLRYVIQTRAKETYYEIDSREIQWEPNDRIDAA